MGSLIVSIKQKIFISSFFAYELKVKKKKRKKSEGGRKDFGRFLFIYLRSYYKTSKFETNNYSCVMTCVPFVPHDKQHSISLDRCNVYRTEPQGQYTLRRAHSLVLGSTFANAPN